MQVLTENEINAYNQTLDDMITAIDSRLYQEVDTDTDDVAFMLKCLKERFKIALVRK